MSAGGRAAALAQLDRARCCAACRLRADDRHSIEQSIAGLAVFGSGFGDAGALKPSLRAARFAGSRLATPAHSFSLCRPQHRRDCRSCRAPPGCPVLEPCLSALFVSAPARRAPERATRTPERATPAGASFPSALVTLCVDEPARVASRRILYRNGADRRGRGPANKQDRARRAHRPHASNYHPLFHFANPFSRAPCDRAHSCITAASAFR